MTESAETNEKMMASDSIPPANHASNTFDVVACGRSSVDLTFLGLPHLPRLGEEYHVTGFAINPGATFTNVCAMSRLGLRTGYAADIGSDIFSRYVLEHIRSAGIDESFIVHHDRDLTNISVGLSFPEDRTFITWDAVRKFKDRGVVLDDLKNNRVRCLFSHFPYRPEVFEEARRQRIPICIDTYWDRDYLESQRVHAAIDQATVFLPNQVEACTITGKHDVKVALTALRDRAEMVVIKLGGDGAIGTKGGQIHYVPAMPVEVVDTTGAGDNFVAGFIYGLAHDLPFLRCIRCAVAAGSLSTLEPGGVKGSPTEVELLEFVDRLEHWAANHP